MRFFTLTSTDYHSLDQDFAGAVWIARHSVAIGSGPDGYYQYATLFAAPSPPEGYADDPMHRAAFGRGEGAAPVLTELTAAEAEAFFERGRWGGRVRPLYPLAEELPEEIREWATSRPKSYETFHGGRAVGGGDVDMVRMLAACWPRAESDPEGPGDLM